MNTVEIYGDEVWEDFSGILTILENNDYEASNCNINYLGTFGDDPNDEAWLSTVPAVVEAVNSITFTEWNSFTDTEKEVVNYTIDFYNLPKEKFIFGN